MDGELSALLLTNGVHPDISAWLAHADQGCTTIKHFASFLDVKSDVQTSVLDYFQVHKNSGAQRTALKQAWREAEAINEARIKRIAEGLQAEVPDEPLSKAA